MSALLLGYINTEVMLVSLPNGIEKFYWNSRGSATIKKESIKFKVSFWLGINGPHRKLSFDKNLLTGEDLLASSIENKKYLDFYKTRILL